MKKPWFMASILALLAAAACQTHHAVEVAPVKVEPIHITIDVNVRIDRALDDFFDDIDEAEEEVQSIPSDEEGSIK